MAVGDEKGVGDRGPGAGELLRKTLCVLDLYRLR